MSFALAAVAPRRDFTLGEDDESVGRSRNHLPKEQSLELRGPCLPNGTYPRLTAKVEIGRLRMDTLKFCR